MSKFSPTSYVIVMQTGSEIEYWNPRPAGSPKDGGGWSSKSYAAHVYETRQRAEKAIKRQQSKGMWIKAKDSDPEVYPMSLADVEALRSAALPVVETPEPKKEIVAVKTLEKITSRLTTDREFAQEKLNKWQEEFAINPIYAMEWSDATFVYAAQLELSVHLIQLIEYGVSKGFSEEQIVAEVKDDATRGFVWKASNITNCSTSQGTNLMSKAKVEVAAKMVEFLNKFAKS